MFRMHSNVQGRAARHSQGITSGSDAMKAASEPSPLPPILSGPAAAVLVALAGAGLVALGLLLVGARETKVGQWAPGLAPLAIQVAG
jgi:hypothetical protein